MSDDRLSRRVFCLRNHVSKEAQEHLDCPYCFGKLHEVVEEGQRKAFCDYDAERDPLNYGFPGDSSRNKSG